METNRLIEFLAKQNEDVIVLAFTYARNIQLYGIDVTERLETAIDQSEHLRKAYLKGYADGIKAMQGEDQWNTPYKGDLK